MYLQVPPDLEAKLARLAAETGRTVDQVALDRLASSMDHDGWFRTEVEKGRVAAREGRLIEHDDVAARISVEQSEPETLAFHCPVGSRDEGTQRRSRNHCWRQAHWLSPKRFAQARRTTSETPPERRISATGFVRTVA